jgi:hypothetical protein
LYLLPPPVRTFAEIEREAQEASLSLVQFIPYYKKNLSTNSLQSFLLKFIAANVPRSIGTKGLVTRIRNKKKTVPFATLKCPTSSFIISIFLVTMNFRTEFYPGQKGGLFFFKKKAPLNPSLIETNPPPGAGPTTASISAFLRPCPLQLLWFWFSSSQPPQSAQQSWPHSDSSAPPKLPISLLRSPKP